MSVEHAPIPPPVSQEEAAYVNTTFGISDQTFRPKNTTPISDLDTAFGILDRIQIDASQLRDKTTVALFMLQSKDERDWDRRSDMVKKANYTYPPFWHQIITGGTFSNTGIGILSLTQNRWQREQHRTAAAQP